MPWTKDGKMYIWDQRLACPETAQQALQDIDDGDPERGLRELFKGIYEFESPDDKKLSKKSPKKSSKK